MEFRACAVEEGLALAGSELSRCSEKSRAELLTLRQAFDAAARSIEGAWQASVPVDQEEAVSALVETLTAAAEAEAEAAVQRTREEASAIADQLRADLHEHARANEQLTASLRDLQTQVETLQHELGAVRGEHARVSRELELRTAENAALAAAETELRQHADEADHEIERLRVDQAAVRRDELVRFALAALEHLQYVFATLDDSGSVADVLAMMVEALAQEFPRVALFHVSGNRLEGVRQVGFDHPSDLSKLAMPLSVDSLLTKAVTTGRPETVAAEEAEGVQTPFGGTSGCAVALPIVVAGETLALIYADDADQAQSDLTAMTELRVNFATLMLRHALPVLSRLKTEEPTLRELHDHATLLLTELETMFSADVEADVSDDQLRDRLMQNLECARRLYARRVTAECPAAGTLFENELASIIEASPATAFGRHLAMLTTAGDRPASGHGRVPA
jgi:hypothetical protein